jgi:uncharacterized damage-inducible protein DinB
MASRIPGVRGEFLWELEIATRQTVAMAEAVPAEMYSWRPQAGVRSVSEVLVHVATGNFILLDVIGVAAPTDLYAHLPAAGGQRFSRLIGRNDELLIAMKDKHDIVALLRRSFEAVAKALTDSSDDDLERSLHFFGETTTVRRVYLRLLAHAHEHMGQLIGYLRFNSIAPPWPDWRPDRRPAQGSQPA